MNILLDAYFDRNFGDDLFVDTITKLFDKYKFYTFMENYPPEIQKWAEKIPNLYLLPECRVMLRKGFFDAYICVGGDIFPDGGDFSKRQSWVDAVKAVNGKIFFLGFNLFTDYREQTQQEITKLMKDADVIAPRDEKSVELLRKWMPEKKISVMADVGFLAGWTKKDTQEVQQITRLGIAVRRPGYADEESMAAYDETIADVINEFLLEDAGREVILFALSNGSVRDEEVAAAITEKVMESTRVKICVYDGDLAYIQQELKQCDFVICTRFHALVACITMGIPYCPVNYEIKMDNLLQELGYKGKKIRFDEIKVLKEHWNSITAQPAEDGIIDAEKMSGYLEKGKTVINTVDELLATWNTTPFAKKDASGTRCEEKDTIKECQKIISQYLKTIEDCQKTNAEYFKLIGEINADKSREQELLQKQTAELEKVISEKTAIQDRLLEMQLDVEEKQKVLEGMSEFFVEGRRKQLMKKIALFHKSEKKDLEAKWKLLEDYFSK